MEIERGRESMWTKICEASKNRGRSSSANHVGGTILSLVFARRFGLAHLDCEVEHAR